MPRLAPSWRPPPLVVFVGHSDAQSETRRRRGSADDWSRFRRATQPAKPFPTVKLECRPDANEHYAVV